MKTLWALVALLVMASSAWGGYRNDAVEVLIKNDQGRELPFYPANGDGRQQTRLYAEAVKGDNYKIFIRNRTGRRVGVVVAVDGRNIISGSKSWLKNNEQMYILEPYGSGEFTGWRSSDDKVNRFYFTTADDSYAAAFSDESAMGVIAVAVFPELRRHEPPVEMYREQSWRSQAAPAPSMAKQSQKAEKMADSAGTGYGHEEYSPVTRVEFEAEKTAMQKVLIKYEWRETLCRNGIISCRTPKQPGNRLWDNGGYAPPPPGRG